MRITLLSFLVLSLFVLSCRKDDKIDTGTNLRLQFSTDSLLFDTVFTSSGTTNRVLKIFNYNKNSVVISDLKLAGGANSPFKININGVAADALQNIKIKGNDSIYVFVKAFIDPNNADSPFLVEDELQITLNGNEQKIPIAAYGQNAVYLNKTVIATNTTFLKGKPYIIYDYAIVNPNVVLTINPGARLYFHKDAKILVSGTLNALGALTDSITFTSDRTERIYDDEPGQWEGIHILKPSINNKINYAVVKNALAGIRVDSLSNNANPKLLLSNSIIKNHEVAGVLGYTASITAINNLMYNCGQYLVVGLYGGDYRFYQNTLANFNYNFPRKTPSVYFNDNLNGDANKVYALNTQFYNNIIYGSLNKELGFDKIGNLGFALDFQNNDIKTDNQDLGTSNIYNSDPLFLDSRRENYQIVSNSPINGLGKDLTSNFYFTDYLSKDLTGKNRVFPSSLGCYEK
ncbi:hypothetical protein I5M32_07085 [Pedobacter sp. SD-b]|uniref:Right handed beta helix region n=1 Tax=Pedobacter segetis TaxID=2793069 RepID=A0ABS1BKH4_9SPHI|nr:hypothetical protein [Pedobacter segetis]MBK0382719.1 hypothetical protein [Pedobacter segetis]